MLALEPGTNGAEPWAWWTNSAGLRRYVNDLLLGELSALRPGRAAPPCWPETPAAYEALAIDSLERLSLTTALADVARPPDLDTTLALERALTLDEWTAVARRGLSTADGHQGFRSSGSSGVPKRCHHHLPWLWQEVKAVAQLVGPRQRVLCLVRSHHIYGFLFGQLLPRALGGVGVIDLAGASPAQVAQQVRPGDLVVGYPEAWAALARLLPRWPDEVVGCSSTAACPDATAQALLEAGLGRLIQIYGSSETAGVGWRDQPGAAFHLHDFWQADPWQPTLLWRLPPPGVSGPSPEPVAVTLPDILRWLDGRHFLPGPRLDGALQIGGTNVHPDAVRQTLCAHPEVREAAVRPMDGPLGQRLKAFVVPRDATPADGLVERLLAWASTRLAPPARPVQLQLGTFLPRNELGKLCDWPEAPECHG